MIELFRNLQAINWFVALIFLQVNLVFLLLPYEKGWFAAINFPDKEALANLAEFSRLGIKVGLQVYDLYYTWGITMSAKALEHSNSSLAPSYWMVFWLCCRSYLIQSYISGILLTSNRPSFILKSFSNLAQRRINSSHDSPWYSFRSEMSKFSSQFCNSLHFASFKRIMWIH